MSVLDGEHPAVIAEVALTRAREAQERMEALLDDVVAMEAVRDGWPISDRRTCRP